MKVIHWTPLENKDSILKNGIQIQDTRIACSILTPFDNLNRWWLDFSLLETGKEYIGVVFELAASDFPLIHDHWVISTYQEIDDNFETIFRRRFRLDEMERSNPSGLFESIEALKDAYKKSIVFRIGEAVKEHTLVLQEDGTYGYDTVEIIETGYEEIKKDPQKAFQEFFDDPEFMEFVFEDYQVLLYNDISPERIEKVINAEDSYTYSEFMEEIKKSVSSEVNK